MSRKIKIFIDSPNYINSSNGTRCIRDLTKFLEKSSFEIIKIKRQANLKEKSKRAFFRRDFKHLKFIFNDFSIKNDWFLACDTTPIYLINYVRKIKIRIIWWQLCPYKFLGSKTIPKIGEYNLPFSSFCDPYSKDYYYFQPDIDKTWLKAIKKANMRDSLITNKICIYNGKGRISKIPKLILDTLPNYEFNIITRSKPSSREEYFEYLLNSDGLITFDEISQTNLEAVSLGIPVFIANKFFPEESISQFILTDFKKYFTSSPTEFLRLIKRKNLNINTLSKKYLESCNNKTLKNFTDILSNKDLPLSINAKKLDQFKSFTNSLIRKRMEWAKNEDIQ